MSKQKVLILYANMGKGHVSAAMATKEALEFLYSDKIEVKVLDFFKLTSKGFSDATENAYNNTVRFIPLFYKAFFEISDQKWEVKLVNKINYLLLHSAMKKILNEINPDIIVSTFPIWDYSIAKMWKKKKPQAKFINIITDSISIHHAWLIADSDYRIVPNEDTAKVLMEKGNVDPNKIKILGFPVSLKFSHPLNSENLLCSLKLNPKLFTVLFFAAIGNNRKNLNILEKIIYEKRDYNVICVTGRNATLMPKIQHLNNQKNVAILGWTDNVPDLIRASDLIISKAGGATIMECISAKKPMIITQIIPGQEEGNAELIESHNLGFILKKGKKGLNELHEMISIIRKDYNKYQIALSKHSKPDAALKIAKLIAGCLGITK
ncbi:glycosyltransferase [Candidatus Peregrinibacteria bacterium]|nr:glycosyltransferase [Candidatus Peregrinibacteria bacterium]